MICKIATEISYGDDSHEATACGNVTGDRPTVQSGQEWALRDARYFKINLQLNEKDYTQAALIQSRF